MILTGNQIYLDYLEKKIEIEPFDINCIEENSYGFHLGDTVLEYNIEDNNPLDIKKNLNFKKTIMTEEGYYLQPKRFYLIATKEKMGSTSYAATLHARFSISSMGMWIQFSAPLGHVGAIIPWTLEIQVSKILHVYPGMKIGKIAFWYNQGDIKLYNGKYHDSSGVIESKIKEDYK